MLFTQESVRSWCKGEDIILLGQRNDYLELS